MLSIRIEDVLNLRGKNPLKCILRSYTTKFFVRETCDAIKLPVPLLGIHSSALIL